MDAFSTSYIEVVPDTAVIEEILLVARRTVRFFIEIVT